jgi:hypothetical protein
MKIRVEFTKEELSALTGLIDNGVKATGLRSVKDAAAILVKLEAALDDTERKEKQTNG